MYNREKELAKTSDLRTASQGRLSDVRSTLREVIGKQKYFKRLHKTAIAEATTLCSGIDGEGGQKRAHSKEIAVLAVQKQQLMLKTQPKKKVAVKEKVQLAHQEKKSVIKYSTQI
jgi:hypothetical protein